MRGELPEAGKRDLHGIVRGVRSSLSAPTRPSKIWMSWRTRSEPSHHHPLDDFTGAGIDDFLAVRPAARGAIVPVDHVVAHVHRIDVGAAAP